jgi:hypothetical protein
MAPQLTVTEPGGGPGPAGRANQRTDPVTCIGHWLTLAD